MAFLSDNFAIKKQIDNNRTKEIIYFDSSGTKDDKYRLETVMRLDTVFKAKKETSKTLTKASKLSTLAF